MTRIAVYGAGAIGGYLGALLHRAGVDVTLIARGPHLAAMREHGLRVHLADEELLVHPASTDDPAEAGEQDYVIVTVKAHSAPALVGPMQPLLGPETAVVTAMNGIPWWYFYGIEGSYQDRRLPLLDPDDAQWQGIGPERVIGCVAWQSSTLTAPGEITHLHGDRLALGEPRGGRSERVLRLAAILREAGIRAPVNREIRNEIWIKLWGNLSFNPISALTGMTLEQLARDPDTRSVIVPMMEEGRAVAEALGVRLRMSVDERIAVGERVGAHRTSMLQDLELGRPMEIDALVSVVAELGRTVGVPTPTIDVVRALVVGRAREAGCYPRSEPV
ncbi:MAG: 2-dehydropantoate 2-reductase [Chloroflexi bacterium]|nr:MAG: 2-dehydropantoate 2-reductase [Chloroflexota bacterium]